MHGARTSPVEITQITPFGIWLMLNAEELYLSFEQFPWFASASVREICNVELPATDHLYWPQLDVDLTKEMVVNPNRFPLTSKAQPH